MITAYRLSVETRGGVCDLSRVVSALALYELTPKSLSVEASGPGLLIKALFGEEAHASGLCAKRLATYVAVTHVAWEPVRQDDA